MKRKRPPVVAFLLLAGVTGCAQMRVEVSVLDRQKAEKTAPFILADARQQRDKVLANRRQGRYDEERAGMKIALRRALNTVLSSDAGKALQTGEETRRLREALEREVDTAFREAQIQYDKGIAELARVESLNFAGPGQHHDMIVSARQWFGRGDEALGNLRAKLNEFFDRLLPGAFAGAAAAALSREGGTTTAATTGAPRDAQLAAVVRSASPQLQAQAQATLTQQARRLEGLIGDAGLLDDPMTPLVVSAPSHYWRGVFNKTYGNGLFGNTDIAVKMQSLGDFTLKGVRNDATKTTPAAFQGALLMTKLAAASLGVPVGAFGSAAPAPAASSGGKDDPCDDGAADGGGGGAGGAAAAPAGNVGDDLLEADRTRREARQQIRLSKLAALQILSAIAEQRQRIMAKETGVEADDAPIKAARQSAVTQVKKSFEDNRAVLEIQSQAQP